MRGEILALREGNFNQLNGPKNLFPDFFETWMNKNFNFDPSLFYAVEEFHEPRFKLFSRDILTS